MDFGLEGKRAVIQGSSSGIGFAVAQVLAHEGVRTVICGRDEGRIEAASKKISGSIPLSVDLDAPGAGARLVEEAVKRLGGIDILVTNTGGPAKGEFHELDASDWEREFRHLWMSAVESIHSALPYMKEGRFGRIILLTSVAAKEPIPGLTVSNAYRAGLLGLMKSVSREVAPFHITVNAVLLGYTRTERLAELGLKEEEFVKNIPAGRLADPEEMGYLAAFLASEKAGYITGQAISSDGGLMRSY